MHCNRLESCHSLYVLLLPLGLGGAGPPLSGVAGVVDGGEGGLHGAGHELVDLLVPVGRGKVDVDRHLPHQGLPHAHARAKGNLNWKMTDYISYRVHHQVRRNPLLTLLTCIWKALAAGGPQMWLPTAQAGWWNIPKSSQLEVSPVLT